MTRWNCVAVILLIALWSCSKKSGDDSSPPANFGSTGIRLNGQSVNSSNYNIGVSPVIQFFFSSAIDKSTVNSAVSFTDKGGAAVTYTVSYENNDQTVALRPSGNLKYLTGYTVSVGTSLQSTSGGHLIGNPSVNFATTIDSSRKFPVITDDALLTLVEQQTFKYFWDFGHPVSGMARERNTSGEMVTTGGTGFAIMTIPVAITRNFITRADGLARVQKIASFLKNNAQHFHGAFSHWMDGSTGAVIPFAADDDGADIVETSYLVMGLLTARQYFNAADASETNLRNDINNIWNQVEWDWFRQNGQNVLYWNWSPTAGWAVNVPIQGWNESMITYVLAASSNTHAIPKIVYDNGFARSGAMQNNNTYYGYTLPLGEPYGGPLFFEHYSFLGIDPVGLSDAYANYQTQTLNHTRINYEYCKANPEQYFGYSDSCWGLTASDIQNGYTASSPTNDVSVIAPTAAISSIPYTPAESMKALKFFYYVLGDKLWGEYGFKDAFSVQNLWFADSYLAIDQGPMIVMIENYRTGLLWNLFTSCPEIKSGMTALGFSAPYL
jgi:hypothetical protein